MRFCLSASRGTKRNGHIATTNRQRATPGDSFSMKKTSRSIAGPRPTAPEPPLVEEGRVLIFSSRGFLLPTAIGAIRIILTGGKSAADSAESV